MSKYIVQYLPTNYPDVWVDDEEFDTLEEAEEYIEEFPGYTHRILQEIPYE